MWCICLDPMAALQLSSDVPSPSSARLPPQKLADLDQFRTDLDAWAESHSDTRPADLCRPRMLLVAKGIATRSKDATRGSWPYY